MKIQGMEKFSLVDYDGFVAVTLFLAGCNYRCPFCQNSGLVTNINPGYEIPLTEIDDYLDKRKGIIDALVISGGEPTIHQELKDLIKHFKAKGLKIKLDTNGTNPKIIKELVNEKLIDYIAMDIKNSFSSYDLTAGTKVNIDAIKESISFIMNANIDYEFRTTLVKEFHTLDDIKEIGEMIKGAKKYCLQKYVSNPNCINPNLREVDKMTALRFIEILKKESIDASLRGY